MTKMKEKLENGEEIKERISRELFPRTPLLHRKSLQRKCVLPDIGVIDDVKDDASLEDCVFVTDDWGDETCCLRVPAPGSIPGSGFNKKDQQEGRKSLSFENIFSAEYEAAVISDIGKTSLNHNHDHDHHHDNNHHHHHNNSNYNNNISNNNNSNNNNKSNNNNGDMNIGNPKSRPLYHLHEERRCLSLQDITNSKQHVYTNNDPNHDHDHCDHVENTCVDREGENDCKYNSGSSHRWDSLSETMSELKHELNCNHITGNLSDGRQEEHQMLALPFAIQEVPDIYVTDDTLQSDVNSKVESWLENSFGAIPPSIEESRRSNSCSSAKERSVPTMLEESVVPLKIERKSSGPAKGRSSKKLPDTLNVLTPDKRSLSYHDFRTESSKFSKRQHIKRLGISFSDGSLGSRKSQMSSLSSVASASPMPQRKGRGKTESFKKLGLSNKLSLPSLPNGRGNGLVASSNGLVDNPNLVIKEKLSKKNPSTGLL